MPSVSAAVRRVLRHRWIEPLVSTALLARLVANPSRFALAQLVGRGRRVRHRLRDGDGIVILEHGTPDVQAFDELFYQRIYAPPPEVDAALAALGRPPRILDVGANIGLFGAWAVARWPGARIDAFEPDPRNAAIHQQAIAASGHAGDWRLSVAAAAAADGEMRFVTGRFAMSRPATADEEAATIVPARDVLPLLVAADLVKIDAEGSEWAILDDPRFTSTTACAVALEYHPELCPEDDARTAAIRRLKAADLNVRDVRTQAPPGYGSLWGWRDR